MRNDLDTVLKRRVFYSPVELSGTGPFHIPSLAEITKLFKHLRKQPHVSNFVIDNYPEIMRNIYSKDDLKIKTITCERFERAIGIVATRKIWKEGDSLWQQDIIFVPCNSEWALVCLGRNVKEEESGISWQKSRRIWLNLPSVMHFLRWAHSRLSWMKVLIWVSGLSSQTHNKMFHNRPT